MKKTPSTYFYTLGLLVGLASGCSQHAPAPSGDNMVSQPIIVSTHNNFSTSSFTLDTPANIQVDLDIETTQAAEKLTITSNNITLADKIDIPQKGRSRVTVHIGTLAAKQHTLSIFSEHSDVTIHAVTLTPVKTLAGVTLTDATQQIGLNTQPTWKYGGPSVADIDNDGDYDFLLSNHHEELPQLFFNHDGKTVIGAPLPLQQGDFHGTALGDYDRDGDLDILIARGGGNGTNPTPPLLFNNRGTHFVDVTEQAGISRLGARGRSVRWVDFDVDGDLDILLLNARTLENETAPRNLVLENNGEGTFSYTASAVFEAVEAERVLVTDFNHDTLPDLVTYTPLNFLEGKGDFTFDNVSHKYLPTHLINANHITGAVEFDLNNDGLLDYYFSRGLVYYELANNSLEFSPTRQRIDLRESGSQGAGEFEFTAPGDITLQDFFHWFRGYKGDFPVYLGEAKTVTQPPLTPPTHSHSSPSPLIVSPTQATGWPTERLESGWYLGYLGEQKWKFGWQLNQPLFWEIRASILGASSLSPHNPPLNSNIQDILLLSTSEQAQPFIDITATAGIPSGGNHQGVTAGDFNNDGYTDLYVYRFGLLTQRVADWLLLNDGANRFQSTTRHGAIGTESLSHGDMGQAFDFNLDGRLDLLNGDDNHGKWHLFLNRPPLNNATAPPENHILVRVCESPDSPTQPSVDPYSAQIQVTSGNQHQVRYVRSAGEIHSQSLLNIAHFGLGSAQEVDRVLVRWRNGQTQALYNLKSNQSVNFGCSP